jgi:hypothetical protein
VVVEKGADPQELAELKKELQELKAAMATKEQPPEKPQDTNLKRSRFLIAYRQLFINPIYISGYGLKSDVMNGREFEIGGLKRDNKIFSGTMQFVYNAYVPDITSGGGLGFFLAPRIVNVGEIFKFVPGINAGVWFYDFGGWCEEWSFGGADFRIMLGYRYVYFDIFYKMQFGMRDEHYLYSDVISTKFNMKHIWGFGISFAIGKGNW